MKVADLHTLKPGTYQIIQRDVDFVPLNSDNPLVGDLSAIVYVVRGSADIPQFYSLFNPSDGSEGFDPGDLAEIRPDDEVDVIRIR